MGVILTGKLVTDEQIEGLLLHPKEAKQFSQSETSNSNGPKKEKLLDLDKAWYALHFLFTGGAWDAGRFPTNFLLSSVHICKDQGVGYGKPYAWFSQEVEQIHHFLQTLSEEELKKRFIPEKIIELDIFPFSRDVHLQKDWEYVFSHFQVLKKFIALAYRKRMGIVLSIS